MVKTQDSKRFIFLLKAIACILITNSHCRAIYPYYFLAIGGGFGNAIFLLVSGYCLAYPKFEFKKWYTVRLKRLLIPTLLVGIIAILLNLKTLSEIGFLSGIKWFIDKYWFVFAICIYYFVYYYIFKRKNKKIICGALIAHLLIYSIAYVILIIVNPNTFWIESDGFSPIKVFFYLGVMLIGGYVRQAEDKNELSFLLRRNWIFYLILCFASFALWAIIYFAIFVLSIGYIVQIIIPFSAAIFAFSFFKLCMAFEENRILIRISNCVKVMAESTLEIYLVQVTLVQYCEKLSFPLNMIVFWASAIIIGIAMHTVLNILLNAFKEKRKIQK